MRTPIRHAIDTGPKVISFTRKSSSQPGGRGLGLLRCKIWYSISQTVSDLGNIHDRSIRAFAVKPRAFGAPLSGFGA